MVILHWIGNVLNFRIIDTRNTTVYNLLLNFPIKDTRNTTIYNMSLHNPPISNASLSWRSWHIIFPRRETEQNISKYFQQKRREINLWFNLSTSVYQVRDSVKTLANSRRSASNSQMRIELANRIFQQVSGPTASK